MELKIGTRVRYKDTGAVGVIIDAPAYIELYRVDFGVRAEWLEPKDLETVKEDEQK